MILLPDVPLAAAAAAKLVHYQAEVDARPTYAERVAEAKRLFGLRNQRGEDAFDAVKEALDRMCSGARRCAYCEDSMADEVEHVRPKDLYPDVVFAWSNYVYACGPCNGPKGSHFAVFPEGTDELVVVSRKPKAEIVPPIAGAPALIDPRAEDATTFMWLDLRDTYKFTPLGKKGTRPYERAKYTIDTLHLNDRDALSRARRAAYVDYVNFVRRYERDRDAKSPPAHLSWLAGELRGRQHPTVWREMKRQREQLPELRELFASVPEAAAW
ncbi:MAG TPA: hypothetical protein VHE35_20930 [Kofleriaceae bacterium]|nr:hypothetical protein [Kofleriaceae bacterium]